MFVKKYNWYAGIVQRDRELFEELMFRYRNYKIYQCPNPDGRSSLTVRMDVWVGGYLESIL